MNAKRLARLALVAALYAVLTQAANALVPGLQLGYGPVQVRLSEGLTMLALLDPLMPVALWLGCLLANLLGGMGIWDILIGPLLTLAAGYATWGLRKTPLLPYLPPIIFNAFGVSAYLYFLSGITFDIPALPLHPYLAMALSIGAGQAVAVGVFGPLFLKAWRLSTRA